MRFSPRTMAIIYFFLGIFFIYVAIQSVEDTIWNVTTVVLALFATLEIGVSIRLMAMYFRMKNNEK
ncbi:YdiK family protein [Virgibacillus kimchii]